MSTQDNTRTIPVAVRRYIEYFAGTDCPKCGREIDGDELICHIDHILPHSRGGESIVFNLEPLCHECNLKKGNAITPRAQKLIDMYARRQCEACAYFQATPVNIDGNNQLRRPQREAHLAVKDYFGDGGDLPAMVILPTGVGKSGVIATVPFGVARGRVLIVTPNLTIKDGIEKKLAGAQCFYRKRGVLDGSAALPRVVVLEQGRVNEEDCLRADIIVANVQQLQGWLHLFPSDFFDLIIVDESHHVPATSWQNIHDAFPGAKAVYVTATPFRSDGQPIIADEVYDFSLAEAMKEGYVKNVVRVSARAAEMTFTIDGEKQELGLEEILELREEAWFSRSVALSEPSNRTIIERTIGIWKKKRESGVCHQIIAAACSVEHARDLKVLFESYGLRATYVVSQGMTLDERNERIDDFDAGRYDVIVHVGILGEGYDNPHISVAAIFRPYRSTAPFAQFVGRAIRHIQGAGKDDNIAHVVDHLGLNMDECWEYFKSQEQQAHILSALDDVGDGEGSGGGGGSDERSERRGEVTSEVIDGFDLDVFVRMKGVDPESIAEDMESLEAVFASMRSQGMSVPDTDEIKSRIAEMNRPMGDGAMPAPANRPDKERQARRSKLHKAVQKAAGRLIQKMDISKGDDLVPLVGNGEERSNYEVVIRALNRRLNEAMGKNGSSSDRNAWLNDEFKEADRLLGDAEQELMDHIEAQTPYGRDDAGFGDFPFPLY